APERGGADRGRACAWLVDRRDPDQRRRLDGCDGDAEAGASGRARAASKDLPAGASRLSGRSGLRAVTPRQPSARRRVGEWGIGAGDPLPPGSVRPRRLLVRRGAVLAEGATGLLWLSLRRPASVDPPRRRRSTVRRLPRPVPGEHRELGARN